MPIDFVNGSYLSDTDADSYLGGLSACTCMAWVKSDNIGTERGFQVANKATTDDVYVSMRFDNVGFESGRDDVLKFGINLSSGQHNRESSANTQTTSWLHVAMTWESGSILKMYLDGIEDDPATGTVGTGEGTFTGTHQPLYIGLGSKDTTSQGWLGLVDDVRNYNRALSAAEILTIYSLKGSDRIYEGLLNRYCFQELSPGTSVDTTAGLVKDWGNEGNRHMTRAGASAPTIVEGILRLGGRRR